MTLQEYNDIYKNPSYKKMTITSSGGITITNENIVSEQMSLEKSLCSETNLRYGKCEAACFKIRIADMNHDFTGEWLNVTQEVSTDSEGYLLTQTGDYLLTESGDRIVLSRNSGEDASVVYGRYKVISDKPTNDRRYRDLVCYDILYDILKADVSTWYNGLTFPMTMANFRNSLFTYLGITQVSTVLCNDSYVVLGGFSVSGTLSGKDVIEAICEMNGVFGQITADQKFDYVSLVDAETLTLDYYVDGTGSYEDYVTERVTGIKARGNVDDVGTSVGTTQNVYIIENNPLVYGNEETQALTQALTRLLDQIKFDSYRPFEVTTYGNPMLPLGTKVTINSRNQVIQSYVLRKELTGIQSLKDRISSTGSPRQEEQVNSFRSEVKRTKGTVHELVVDVNGLTSRVTSTETNLQNNYSTTLQTQGMIQTSATGIMSQVSQNYVTQNTYNAEIQNLQDQIDGRIDYYDGNVIPTLNNPPASTWTTTSAKDSHVGDLYRYHYTESGEEKVKYYRFDKDTSTTPTTYAWLELGESEVDEALRLANEANQKATQAQEDLAALQDDVEGLQELTTDMQSEIVQTAASIVSTVSRSQDKYDESELPDGVSISDYGYGVPTSDPTEHSGEYYLDNLTGQVYYSDGTDWSAYGDPLQKVTDKIQSDVTQQAGEVVVKVDGNGRLVKVALGINASSGSHFSVKADDIDFVANNRIQLTADKALGISSPNFSVDPGGAITATSGKIGAWDITSTSLQSSHTENNTDYAVLLVPWRSGLQVTNNAIIVRSKATTASSWTNQFSVAWNGKMVARNAEVTGTITTNNITATGGTIGSLNISANGLYSEYSSGNTKYRWYVNVANDDPERNCMVVRHTTNNGQSYTYPVIIKYNGSASFTNISATGGSIGAWHITSNYLYSEYVSGNTAHRVTIRTNQGAANNDAIYTRSTTDGGANYTYPFLLKYDGSLTATKANITGTITTSNLTATGGTVGGWSMTSGKIYGGNSTLGVAVMQSPQTNTEWTFASGGTSHSSYANCPFRVDQSGNLIGKYFVSSTNSGKWIDVVNKKCTYINPEYIIMKDSSGNNIHYLQAISDLTPYVHFSGRVYVAGAFSATGTKSRVADTEDYGKRLLYCYETPTPMFGDVGEGKIAEDGKCYVWLDSTFSETIKTQSYQVFLQKYGQGECYVTERTARYFVVEGEPGLSFGWEIKARQDGFENMRLESYYEQDPKDIEEPTDFAQEAIRHLEIIREEREVA